MTFYSPRRDEAELVSRRGSNDKTDVIEDKKEHFSVRVQLWKRRGNLPIMYFDSDF